MLTVAPAAFLAIAFWQQQHLGAALREGWPFLVLAFVVGGLTVVLPRKLPLIGSIVAVIVFAWVSTHTAFDALTLMFSVVAGFFFGLGVKALLYQLRH